MEREFLSEMFPADEFRVIEAADPTSTPTVFVFTLKPRTGHAGMAKVRVKAELRIELGTAYPDEPPTISLTNCRDLSEADAEAILAACREIATDSVGMECCYGIVDPALDKLSHLNESVIDCAICLSMIDVDDEEGSFTAQCYHSFHNSCLFKWVQQLRHTWMADNFADDSVLIRHVASCRSEAQARARAESALRSELEAVKLQIESLEQEIAACKDEIARTPNEDGRNDAVLAELAGQLKESEAARARCVTARDASKAKVRNAAVKREEAEVKLAQQQDKVSQTMRDTRPTVGCPVCRVPIEWTEHREEQFTAWCAGAAASESADHAEVESAASELDAATKAYLSTFRARMAAITAKQREAGGIIDPSAPQGIVVGDNPATSPTGGSGGK